MTSKHLMLGLLVLAVLALGWAIALLATGHDVAAAEFAKTAGIVIAIGFGVLMLGVGLSNC